MGNHQVSGCDPDPWESHPCLFRRQPRTEVSLCPVSVMASSESDSDFAAWVCALGSLALAVSVGQGGSVMADLLLWLGLLPRYRECT